MKTVTRKFKSPTEPELSAKEPRKMASIQAMYTKCSLKVPSDLKITTIGSMLEPLELEVIAKGGGNSCSKSEEYEMVGF